jgi:putative ABC transport system substrate-binding protein
MRGLSMLVKHFGVGAGLILLAGAALLVSDPKWNRAKAKEGPTKIAVVNYLAVPVLEDGQAGLLAGLAESGFIEGENIELTFFSAEGDRATGIMLAKEVTAADYDLILSLSTPVLQAIAGANTTEQKPHVFTLSTDPWGAGVGISRDDPAEHPPYMTGHGTLQPVRKLFELARQANPRLKRVGVVWNPAESNSEASTLLAREVSKELGIELLEVPIDTSSAVLDAAKALLAREVEAFWVGGDTTVAAALDTLIATARDGGVPVFTNMPSDVKLGAVFALGADYYEVGRASGHLAARVLRGESPADIPVENFVPEELALNRPALAPFQANWRFPPDWPSRAKLLIEESDTSRIR